MVKKYVHKTTEVEAIQFLCTPQQVLDIKKFGGASIGPVTKNVDTFSKPFISVETFSGRRKTITEGDYIVKQNDRIFVRTKDRFEEEYLEKESLNGLDTFNELYKQSYSLLSTVCKLYPNISWKSWIHTDDSMCNNNFIIGVETPKGTYRHYCNKDLWELFDVKVLENHSNNCEFICDASVLLSLLEN